MKNDASQPQNIVILFLIIKNKQFPFESVCTFMGTVIGSFTNAEGPFTDAEGPFTYVESTLLRCRRCAKTKINENNCIGK